MKRIETIKDQKTFNDIIKNGHFKKNNLLVIYNKEREDSNIKYGIAISNKVGNAVIRNRIKRRVRFIIDNNRNLFKNGNNYIIMIRKSCQEATYQKLEEALVSLIEK
ncbi:MAG: ribonuclease P protein component [Bacilli bacterium]|nr:ribonuclease P protein component [Bacilli bacterium]